MIGFFVVVITLLALQIDKHRDFEFLQDCDKIIVVSDREIENKNYIIKNGNQFYYEFNDINSLSEEKFSAYNFYFDSSKNINEIISNLSFVYQGKSVENYQIYYGYYDNYNDYRYVDGKKINVQVVKTPSQIIVGFPLVVTGY